jgi:hypothetical protein
MSDNKKHDPLAGLDASQLQSVLQALEEEKKQRAFNRGDASLHPWLAWMRGLDIQGPSSDTHVASAPVIPSRGDDLAPRRIVNSATPEEPKVRFFATLARPSEQEPVGVIAEADYALVGDTDRD